MRGAFKSEMKNQFCQNYGTPNNEKVETVDQPKSVSLLSIKLSSSLQPLLLSYAEITQQLIFRLNLVKFGSWLNNRRGGRRANSKILGTLFSLYEKAKRKDIRPHHWGGGAMASCAYLTKAPKRSVGAYIGHWNWMESAGSGLPWVTRSLANSFDDC